MPCAGIWNKAYAALLSHLEAEPPASRAISFRALPLCSRCRSPAAEVARKKDSLEPKRWGVGEQINHGAPTGLWGYRSASGRFGRPGSVGAFLRCSGVSICSYSG